MSCLYAGQHNDSRMNVALIMTAVRLGAIVANHCEVVELHKGDAGKLIGARVKDNLTGKEWDIRAKVSSAFLLSMSINITLFRASSMPLGPSPITSWPSMTFPINPLFNLHLAST